jgi:protein-tyrosine phosphatase
MPPSPWSDSMYQELENIYQKRNLLPIIAHIDRYIGPFHTFGIPRRLADLPVMVQANADFFLNRFTAPMAIRMLKEDAIQLLGSDCHNLGARKPNMHEALEKIQKRLGKEAISRINYHSQNLLGG